MNSENCAEFIWEIENFSFNNMAHSSSNFTTKNNENLFYLFSHSKNSLHILSDYALIQIHQPNYKNLKIQCTFSLLNQKDEKCYTAQSLTIFGGKIYSPEIGGLFLIKHANLSNPENKLLINGKLRIHCEVKVLNKESYETTKTNIDKKEIQNENLKALEDYESLLGSCKHSDVVFVVGKKEFKLHKAILSARSPVFSAMFDSDLSENKQNRVDIPDVEVEVFEELVRFIYTGKLPSMEQYALELFVASDKYQFKSIKELCESSLGENLSIESLASVLTLADMHSASKLKSKCVNFFTKNATKIMKSEDWKELVKTKHDLAMELFEELATKAKSFLE